MKYLALELFFIGSKENSRDADHGFLDVPRRRDVLEGNFKVAALARSKGSRLRGKHGAGFAQNDLAKFVGEFDSELDVEEGQVASISQAAREHGDLLMQKIFSTAECQVFYLNLQRICLFSGPKREM